MSPGRGSSASSRVRSAAGLALLVLALVGAAPAGSDELVSLGTRTGVTQAFLLIRPAGAPAASVVLFAGGHGHLALLSSGMGWGHNNFLVRNRHRVAERGLLVAVVDAPSDREPWGCGAFEAASLTPRTCGP